ncbi:MAG: hypothetical protein KGM92_09250, partial [Acidobacteriota bacterium]|nr:hypothetical protein [Acidobacteriota bacterium]
EDENLAGVARVQFRRQRVQPELTSEWPALIAMYCLPPTAPPGSRARLAWKNSNMAAGGVATRFSRFHSYRAALA